MKRLYIEGRVDMTKGHFGVYRMNGSRREYWNDKQNKWVGYGCTVYENVEEAVAKIEELQSK